MNQQRIFLIAGKITLVVFIGLSGFFTLSESAVAARRSRGTAVRPTRRGTQRASCSKSLSSKESGFYGSSKVARSCPFVRPTD